MNKLCGFLKKRKIVFLTIIAFTIAASPVQAIEWCHDYVFWVISKGQNSNGMPPQKLRDELKKRGYDIFKVLTRGTANESGFLKKGDVLIFDEAHSGVVVDDKGRIDHFLQKFGTTGRSANAPNPKAVTYTPEEAITEYDPILKTTLLRRAWTIQQIRSFTYNIPSLGIKQSGPGGFANSKIEVWRPTLDLVVNVLESESDKKVVDAEVRVRSISAGTEIVAVLTDANGSTGKLAIPGDKIAQGLQVRVKSKDHKEKWSDVTRDRLSWSEELNFPIILEPNFDARLYGTWYYENKFRTGEIIFRKDGTGTYTSKQVPPYPHNITFTNKFTVLSNDPTTGIYLEIWDPTKTHRRVFKFLDGKLDNDGDYFTKR